MAVQIRRMRAADVLAVARIERAVFAREAWPPSAFARAGAAFLQSRPTGGGLWVADAEGTIIGYAALELSVLGGEGDLVNLAVTPAWRKRGVAARLLAAVVGLCRQRRVRLLWLRVRASNRAARAVYRRAGFRMAGRFRGYYEAPREDAVLMARWLSARVGRRGTARRPARG